ncbi:MAG: PDZ domain-containing protein [Candidatus Acidiferrales bacterium]
MKLRVPFFVLALTFPLAFSTLQSQSQSAQAPRVQDPSAIRYSYGGNATEIPATFLGDLIFLPVQVNGAAPGFFLLDSTAAATTVEPPAHQDAAANAALAYAVLKMPGIQIPMATLPVLAHPKFAQQFGEQARGVFGLDFLKRTVVEINYNRQTLRLYDPSAFTYSGQGTSYPIVMTPAGATVRAKFEIAGHKGYEAAFVFDTALDYSFLFSRLFTDSQKISAAHFKSVEASDPRVDEGAKIFLGRIRAFELKPFRIEDSIGAFSQQNLFGGFDSKLAGAMGGGFLRRFNVIFDLPHQRVILEPNLQINTVEDADMSGLAIVAKGANLRTFEVVAVQKGTPGHDAGIQVGDVISGVDDEPAADYTLTALREAFCKTGNETAGHSYKLLIERNGQTLTVKMKMRRLI